MEVIEYSNKYYDIWNSFVMEMSINGTFLQSRFFLDYHPEDRFKDASILIYHNNKLIAVCPACMEIDDNGDKVLYSHKGSTYGGLVISKKTYKAERILEIIDMFDEYIKKVGYKKVILKITPDILQDENSDLLQFGLVYKGYKQQVGLNTYIDLDSYKEDILSNFEQGKRTHIHNCIKEGLFIEKIERKSQIKEFYDLLCETLCKYNLRPVHTMEEIMSLKDIHITKYMDIYGVYMNHKMIAGAMIFKFERTKCIHLQYSVAMHGYEKLSPMSFVYYAIIDIAKRMGYRYVSWGISTDHEGILNTGLTKSKEAFGSFHCLFRTFEKEYIL